MPNDAHCPDTEVLRGFLLGRFPPAEVERLAGHVEGCGRCIAILKTLHDSDPLLDAFGAPPPGARKPPAGLVEQMYVLRPPEGATTDFSSGLLAQLTEPPADATQELYDFLAPAEGPDELGRLGPYRVLRVLGAGGMGVVFEAEDTGLKRRVALKALRPALAASPSARRRFLREGQAAAAVAHDRIVPLFQVGEERGVPFLTMPLLQGETLEDRLRRAAPLPLSEVLRIGGEIAEGLAAAHAHGLIHRDVKPSNVWLESEVGAASRAAPEGPATGGRVKEGPARLAGPTGGRVKEGPARLAGPTGGRVKLLDFGLARAIGGDAHLTQSGVVVGTPAYMAPEQARGEPVDARADLFSLGCVLYRMATGRVPFPGANALATLLALAHAHPKDPARLNPQVPRALSLLILKLLAKRAENRYPSAEAVGEALRQVATGRPARRSRPWLGAFVMVLAAALGLAGYRLALRPPAVEDRKADNPPPASREIFAPAVSYEAGLYPNDVAVADFNGDGKLDVAVANLHSHSVSILIGNGDGSFRKAVSAPAGEWFAHSVTVGDVNGDGKPDLVVANQGSHKISVLLGKGDGTFAAPVQYGVDTGPVTIAAVDLDGNGTLDLAVANGAGTVSVLRGRGDGTFEPATQLRAGKVCSDGKAADLDGDGKPDLVVLDRYEAVVVLRGKGDGTFLPAIRCELPGAQEAAVGDFNGDGKPDLAVALATSDPTRGLAFLPGNGDGTFGTPVYYPTGKGWHGIVAGDFDRDSRLDVVLTERSQGEVRVLRGNGDGTFEDGRAQQVGREPIRLAAGDFNGDGSLDLVVANHSSNDVSVLLNQTVRSYQSYLGPPVFFGAGGELSAVAVADLNRDGRPDVVATDREKHVVQVFHGRAGGTFAAAGSHATGKAPAAVVVRDFNGDGKLDLAVACAGDNAVSLLLGADNGGFQPAARWPTGKRPGALAAGDFNRDGRIDLVVADYEDGTVSVLLGNGDGTFRPRRRVPAGSRPRFLAVGDFDGDGRPDLAVANYFQVGTVRLLRGQGDGTFTPGVTCAVGSFPVSVVAADFNRDGKADLAALNWGSSDVNILLGNGDGTFRTPHNYPAASYATALAAGDFDGDGRLDLVASSRNLNGAYLLRGDGRGGFERSNDNRAIFATGLSPEALATGDFNGDARLDLVVANARSGNLCMLPNRPPAAHFRVWAVPQRIGTAEMTFTLHVRALDRLANDAPDFTGTIHFGSSDPEAVLPGTATFTAADSGYRRFPVTLRAAGSQVLTVRDSREGWLPCSAAVRVLRPADLHFNLEAPRTVTAGQPFGVTVNVMVISGRWQEGYAGRVHFTCTDPAARLPADFPFPGGEKTLHTFPSAVTLRTPGRWKLTVTDTAIPQVTGSAMVTVWPALGITPAGARSGSSGSGMGIASMKILFPLQPGADRWKD